MRGVLVESGARPQISPAALCTSIAVWGLTFAAIANDRATARQSAAAGSQTVERVRYVQPPLPAAHADLFGGLTYTTGNGPSAAARGSGGGRGGHTKSTAVKQMAPAPVEKPPGDGGEVYIESDVDTPVSRDPTSAAPAYPKYLEETHIEGFVVAEYVVDTSGHADSTSLRIVVASHPAFGESLRAALPGMRFVPATLNGNKVRQRVRQEFLFQLGPAPAPTRTTT
jgi:protein TonB